jgi:hypothetical protein
MAEETLVQIHRHPDRSHRASLRTQNRFLMDDARICGFELRFPAITITSTGGGTYQFQRV